MSGLQVRLFLPWLDPSVWQGVVQTQSQALSSTAVLTLAERLKAHHITSSASWHACTVAWMALCWPAIAQSACPGYTRHCDTEESPRLVSRRFGMRMPSSKSADQMQASQGWLLCGRHEAGMAFSR